jgi:gentisate 1,2-dioxygenase
MSSHAPTPPPAETPERLAFYERIGRKHITPLWVSLANLVTPEPVSFVAVEGHGRTRVGKDFVVEWQPRVFFVVPSWKHVAHEVADESVLFSFSDRPTRICRLKRPAGTRAGVSSRPRSSWITCSCSTSRSTSARFDETSHSSR